MAIDKINEVVIVGMARSPIGDFMGALSKLTAVQLAEQVCKEAISRCGIDVSEIDEVVAGTVYKHGLKGNPARQIQIDLGLRVSGGAVTVEQQCASSMRALEIAVEQIQLGKTATALVAGLESMSNAPFMIMNGRKGLKRGKSKFEDALYYDALNDAFSEESVIKTAENVANMYCISRKEQDEYAVLSQTRALTAIEEGTFKEEIVPITIESKKGTKIVDRDEHPREVTLDGLSKLRTVFPGGTVTAGNASGINDGACAAIIMSSEHAKKLGVAPLCRIVSSATVGCSPEVMGIGPIYSIPKALEFAGMKIEDIDYFEINEAFAAQVIPCLKELNISLDKVNANGSGIALGHPVGMTGLRLVISAYYELKRRGGKYACSSLCAGGGPSMAVIIENVN